MRGFGNSFSAYIQWLISRDLDGGVVREDIPIEQRRGLTYNALRLAEDEARTTTSEIPADPPPKEPDIPHPATAHPRRAIK